jgi:hypothetical protein
MNAQEEAVYEEIITKRLSRTQQTKLQQFMDSTPYTSTVLRGLVDFLESVEATDQAAALASFIVNVFAPLEAQSV